MSIADKLKKLSDDVLNKEFEETYRIVNAECEFYSNLLDNLIDKTLKQNDLQIMTTIGFKNRDIGINLNACRNSKYNLKKKVDDMKIYFANDESTEKHNIMIYNRKHKVVRLDAYNPEV
jgi:hypothetical protein